MWSRNISGALQRISPETALQIAQLIVDDLHKQLQENPITKKLLPALANASFDMIAHAKDDIAADLEKEYARRAVRQRHAKALETAYEELEVLEGTRWSRHNIAGRCAKPKRAPRKATT